MATYHGRRAPNFSQYLRDLNEISPQEPPVSEENFNLEDELAIFTNTQFFDWDAGQNADFQGQPQQAKPETEERQTTTSSPDEATPSNVRDLSALDFMSGDFSYPEISSYPTPTGAQFPETLGSILPIPANGQAPYASGLGSQQGAYPSAPQTGDKRKADSFNGHNKAMNFEEQSRVAAEEDKRKRNTAASARFRVKKKAREQALEKSAKELNDKVSNLESRIHHLETENKWLRELVMEKTGGNDSIVTSLLKEYGAKSASLNGTDSAPESEKQTGKSKTDA